MEASQPILERTAESVVAAQAVSVTNTSEAQAEISCSLDDPEGFEMCAGWGLVLLNERCHRVSRECIIHAFSSHIGPILFIYLLHHSLYNIYGRNMYSRRGTSNNFSYFLLSLLDQHVELYLILVV